jgi:hypothetical protein
VPTILKYLKQPEWCLVIIALVTAGVVIWQSWEMRRAAEAAKEAATSAKEQAKQMVASERPCLLTEIKEERNGEYPVIICRVTNYGKTPAKIIDSFAKFSRASFEEDLPEKSEDEYRKDLGPPLKTPHHEWIAPSKSFQVFPPYDTGLLGETEPQCWEAILNGRVHLYFLGYVQYRDTLSNDMHETRFCYRYGYSSKGESGLYMAGPAGYNELT